MKKCLYCDKPALCEVGKDNTLVCGQHFNEYLSGKMAIVEKITKLKE